MAFSIEFKSIVYHLGSHPADEHPDLIHGAKFLGTLSSIHSVVTLVMDMVQDLVEIRTKVSKVVITSVIHPF